MRRATSSGRSWTAFLVMSLGACTDARQEVYSGDEDIGAEEMPITEPGAASGRASVAVIAKLVGRSFRSYCTGVLLDFNAADMDFDNAETGKVPYWVLTAAHCIGLATGQADTYQAVLPNVCVNEDEEPVACDETNPVKFAFTFRTNDCYFSSRGLRQGLTGDATRKGDAALCKITNCSVEPYKNYPWQMPKLVRDRIGGTRTVTVHGQRHARGFVPAFRDYVGWEPDPKARTQNPDDQGTKIWPANRTATQTRGLVWSVAKERQTAGMTYNFDTSRGTLDHGDSGGPALIAEGTRVVSTNHTTSRKYYTGVLEKTAAECRTERDKAEEARNANTVAACQRTTRIVDSHATLIWEAMGQDIVASRNDYWLDDDDERAGSGFTGPAALRSVLVAGQSIGDEEEYLPPIYGDQFRSANQTCIGEPIPLDETDDGEPGPDAGPGEDAGSGHDADAGLPGGDDAGLPGGDDAGLPGGDDAGLPGGDDAGLGDDRRWRPVRVVREAP
jgi:hypothetical protein